MAVFLSVDLFLLVDRFHGHHCAMLSVPSCHLLCKILRSDTLGSAACDGTDCRCHRKSYWLIFNLAMCRVDQGHCLRYINSPFCWLCIWATIQLSIYGICLESFVCISTELVHQKQCISMNLLPNTRSTDNYVVYMV